MARKKKEEPKAEQPEQQEPERKFLTKEEMLNMDLFEARLETLKAKADAMIVKRELYLKEIDPQGGYYKFGETIRDNNAKVAELKEKNEAFRKSIEARLKINLKDYAYDDETGLLNFVVDQ